MTVTPHPTPSLPLSVVVVSFNGPRNLVTCLTALVPQAQSTGAEVLVAANWWSTAGTDAALTDMFPTVRWVHAPDLTTVPILRRLGISASCGAIVALLEDDCEVLPGWCAAVLKAHQSNATAIGGAVEPGLYTRGLDWGVYFCEYGRYMLPLAGRPTADLACNNVSYKREALDTLPADVGLYDVFVHRAWLSEGRILRSDATLVVRNTNLWTSRHVTVVPFHHGRAFGGQRSARWSPVFRAGVSVLALFLPLLAAARIMTTVVRRRRHLMRLVQALPWIALFTASWSIGESAGYLLGPGDSPARWR